MIRCLAIDWSHDSAPPLAELFRLSSSDLGAESLLLCLSPRTYRLFPQLEGWARDEGFKLGIWIQAEGEEAERKADWVLKGSGPDSGLTFQGEPEDFSLATHPGELVSPKRTAQGT